MSAAAAKAAAAAQEAVERKLRPVYDAVDCRNYKLGLKSVTAIIQARRAAARCALRLVRTHRSAARCAEPRGAAARR
jgi:hypothetical protein